MIVKNAKHGTGTNQPLITFINAGTTTISISIVIDTIPSVTIIIHTMILVTVFGLILVVVVGFIVVLGGISRLGRWSGSKVMRR